MTLGGEGDPTTGAGAGQASPGSTYAEFRLRIERGPKRRTYRVIASGPAGQVEGAFKLPFSDLELENFVLKVGGTRKGVRSLESPEMDLAKSFGTKLFDALFETDVRGLYRASTVEATNAGNGLRITLALSGVPELLRVPWEYLYDRPLFPSTDRRTPIVRYLDLPKPIKPFKTKLPLRILAIVSAPTDAPVIDGTQERAKLEEALGPLLTTGAVEIEWLEDANLSALYHLLSTKDRREFHILHFIGHGGYVNEAKEGVLLFEGKDGRHQNETGDKLGAILHGEDSLRLAVLNSCEGARASLNDPFSSVATSLIEHEVPAVIGMQFEITDRAAILFSGEFYAALADGRAVDEALSQARMAIFADNNDIEWGTPVLFMRVTDGRLFDVETPTVAPVPVAGPAADGDGTRLGLAGAAAVAAGVQPDADVAAEAERQRKEEAAAAEAERLRQEQAAAAEAERQEAAAAAEADRVREERAAAEVERQRQEQAAAAEAERLRQEQVAVEAAERQRLEQAAAEEERQRQALAAAAAATAAAEEERLRQEQAATAAATAETAAAAQAAEQKHQSARRRRRTAIIVAALIGVPVVLFAAVALSSLGAASIQVSASPGGPAEVVSVKGTGFDPGEEVSLEIAAILVGTTIAASDGSIDASVTVPPSVTSPILVTALGKSSDRLAFSTFALAVAGNESPPPTATGVPPSDASLPPPPPATAKILFYSNVEPGSDETDNEIYAVDPLTMEIGEPLTQNDVDDTFPAWSPDHSQIAFARGKAGSRDLFVMDADGGSERELVTGPGDDWFPAWSPDGTIAFVRGTDGAQIWVVVEGEAPVLLASFPAGRYFRSPAWAHDGSVLAVWGDAEEAGNDDLYALFPDGRLQRITSDPVVDRNPTWSPDGSMIAFVRDQGRSGSADNDIWTLDVATGDLRQLTQNNVQDGNPVWSPDGTQIAFYQATGDNGFHIHVLGATEEGSIDLMDGRPGRNLDPNWR